MTENTDQGYRNEAELVDKIRQSNGYDKNLEVVAVINKVVVGHGLLSEVYVDNKDCREIGLVLMQLSVDIYHQNKGI